MWSSISVVTITISNYFLGQFMFLTLKLDSVGLGEPEYQKKTASTKRHSKSDIRLQCSGFGLTDFKTAGKRQLTFLFYFIK